MPTTTYDLLASNVLSSATSSVTFSSISGSYRDLVVVATAQTPSGFSDNFALRLNGNAGSQYNLVYAEGYGTSSLNSSTIASTTWIVTSQSYSAITPTTPGLLIANIMDYSTTDKHKTILSRVGQTVSGGTTMMASRYASTSAITSVTVLTTGANFIAGSSFYLYGIVS